MNNTPPQYDSIRDLFQFTPAPEQARAVELAAEHKVVIVTGGPGVGKTATTNAIINLFETNGLFVSLCAPTGKAAIRMAEQTGRDSSTIHRLLGYTFEGWKYNLDNPLPTDVVVLDEASMVDLELFEALTDALPSDARFVIVGDADQLPSIGPGRVLYDLIESNNVATVRLTKIFRQAEESRIPYIARDINTGAAVDTAALDPNGDVMWFEVDDPDAIARGVVSAFTTHLPNRGFAADDIQVICPQRSRACGVEPLNAVLQRELNPNAGSDNSIKIGADYVAYEGDRVINTRNNYQLLCFNGEIGKVLRVNWRGLTHLPEGTLVPTAEGPVEPTGNVEGKYVIVIDFGDRKLAFRKDCIRDLQLAYAITIHKSQGSQFKAVVMPVHSCHNFMLTRPLVYTGITRASECLLLMGESQALGKSSVDTRGVARRTTLQEELRA